ncbi:MAG: BREX-1 system phosphatase PglZ type A [Anaerolineaceae bacterium]
MSQINNSLISLFLKHRIVFWYDTKKEMRGEFNEIYLPGVEKIEITNNQFGLKYTILREHPSQKYLLYFEGPQPNDIDNWLLDVQLANVVFSADQAAIWLSELGLDPSFLTMIQTHNEFFGSERNRLALKPMIKSGDSISAIMEYMLAILAGSDPQLDEILTIILIELARNKQDKINLLNKCNLDEFFWKEVKQRFGYTSQEIGIEDLALKLFNSGYLVGIGEKPILNNDAHVFIRRFKDNTKSMKEYDLLAEKYSDILSIDADLAHRDYRKLVDVDIFENIEKKIIQELVRGVKEKTIQPSACRELVRKRRSSHWFSKYEYLYEVIENAAWFIEYLQEINIKIDNFQDGIQKYSKSWFKLDQSYRKVIYYSRLAGNLPVIEELLNFIENQYTNNFLLKVNNLWQDQINTLTLWNSSPIPIQSDFFIRYIQPFIDDHKKVYVVISDALRYEVGDELTQTINREDRYEALIEPMVSMLPSYTQLGMAALLPHINLRIASDTSGTVFIDDINSSGSDNREKILKKTVAHATVIRAEDFLEFTREQNRELVKDNDVIYIYHNHIDATGDKKDSENRVFDAVEETIVELVNILKKLTAGNATNMIITTDHGFIYQNRAIDESDFTTIQASANEILYQNRRFVLGKGLLPNPGLKNFIPANLGLVGDVEVQIPKSISRLRLSGSGSRYVHGGAALQEIVIPVIIINKKRESDISQVNVDVIKSTSNIISTSQLSVTLYQTEPASEKRQLRMLRAAIYTQDNKCISDIHEFIFDIESENSRDRERSVRFLLTRDSDKANNQDIFLKLDEKIPNTDQYKEYKKVTYTLRRTFTADFDF